MSNNPSQLVQKLWNYCIPQARHGMMACPAAWQKWSGGLSVLEELEAVVSANLQRATTSASPSSKKHFPQNFNSINNVARDHHQQVQKHSRSDSPA
ncbi:MAG TPA: hypothetical protein VIT91_18135 [Chthoniobacterales bacterium]